MKVLTIVLTKIWVGNSTLYIPSPDSDGPERYWAAPPVQQNAFLIFNVSVIDTYNKGGLISEGKYYFQFGPTLKLVLQLVLKTFSDINPTLIITMMKEVFSKYSKATFLLLYFIKYHILYSYLYAIKLCKPFCFKNLGECFSWWLLLSDMFYFCLCKVGHTHKFSCPNLYIECRYKRYRH